MRLTLDYVITSLKSGVTARVNKLKLSYRWDLKEKELMVSHPLWTRESYADRSTFETHLENGAVTLDWSQAVNKSIEELFQ